MKILVQTKSDIKATGMPKGSMIDYNDAPEYMQKRHDDLVSSKPSHECIMNGIHSMIQALKIRKATAGNHPIIAYSKQEEMVLSLINAADFKGKMCLPA